MPEPDLPSDVEVRVETLAHDTDFGWVALALLSKRDEVLERWLEAAADQPFHAGRREHAVADDIPRLFDALGELLRREAPRWVEPTAPLDDPAIAKAARDHARLRAEQGLQPAEVVVEFRLLRQEIWKALRAHLPDSVPTGDVIGAELLVNDALDGAITVGLAALTERIETVREDFLATTVHEVRQPITLLRGTAQLAARMLGRADPNLGRVQEQLRQIEETTDRMAALLLTLSETSRAVLGRLDLQRVAVDLAPMLRDAIDRLPHDARERVQLDLAPGLETGGQWDPTRLEQVIDNLLSNAVKYSPRGGPIDVVVRGDARSLHLSVRDRGIGIATDDIPGLFQRYARARDAIEQRIGGLGLGLYLVRAIVEAHGGRIWAESAGRGQGTTMQVTLPRRGPDGRA